MAWLGRSVGWAALCIAVNAGCGDDGMTPPADRDGDGFPQGVDCDDRDPDVIPGSEQPCAAECDGGAEEGVRVCRSDGTFTACLCPGDPRPDAGTADAGRPDAGSDAGRDAGGVDAGSECDGSRPVSFEIVSGASFIYPLAGGTGSWTYNEAAGGSDVTVVRWEITAPAGCAIDRVVMSLPEALPDDPDRGCGTPGTCALARTAGARYRVRTSGTTTEVRDQSAAGPSLTLDVAGSERTVTIELGDVTTDAVRGARYVVFHDATFHFQ